MEPVDYIIIAVVAVILGLAAWFVIRSKKRGRKCIGCPDPSHCSGNCSSCGHEQKETK